MRVDVRPASRVRWTARAPRLAAAVVAAALVAIAVAGALPQDRLIAAEDHRPAAPDFTAGAVAEEFARAYLTFDGGADEHARSVARFTSASLPESAGLRPADGIRQRVLWSSVAGINTDRRGSRVRVLAETTSGPVQLAVHVARDAHGFRTVDELPAWLAAPPIAHRAQSDEEDPVTDGALVAVARRAIANFVSGARANLLADLMPRAVVVVPSRRLRVRRVESVTWVRPRRRVAVTVDATDAAGTRMTLRYEIEVRRVTGRWLVRAIEDTPNGSETP